MVNLSKIAARISRRSSPIPSVSLELEDNTWPKYLYVHSPEFHPIHGDFYDQWVNDDGISGPDHHNNHDLEDSYMESLIEINTKSKEWFQQFNIEAKNCEGDDPDVLLLSIRNEADFDRLISAVKSIFNSVDRDSPQGLDGWIYYTFRNAKIHEIEEFRAPPRTMIRSDGAGGVDVVNAPEEPKKTYLH
jgi:hypothetical protein